MNVPDGQQPPSPWIIDTTAETFELDVVQRSRVLPVVVDFWAAWCQPCRLLGPILEKLAVEYDGRFQLVKADTEQLPAAAGQFGVQSIPAVFGLRDGQLVDYFVGVLPEDQLRAWLDRLLPTEAERLLADARTEQPTNAAAAEEKYREAIQRDPNLVGAKIGLAQLLLDAARADESRELISELEKRGFLEPDAQKIKAALDLQQQGQEVGSIDSCRALVAEQPDDLTLRLKLAEALAAAAQYEEALDICLDTVQRDRGELREAARQLMVDVFRLLPDDSELTSTYRRKLSTALY